MIFKSKKNKFLIYTNELPVKNNPLYIKNKEYIFNNDGTLVLELKPNTYTITTMQKELVYSFTDSNQVYFIYKEDNDCHYNLLIKDISYDEFEKIKNKRR